MEPKKNAGADLEKLRSTYLLGGLILALLLVFVIVNMRFYDVKASEIVQRLGDDEEEEIIPITEQNTPPPPPPPPPQAPEILEIVEDDEEIEDELEMEDTEMEADTEVEVFEAEEEVEEEDEIFLIVEDPASFPGGDAALMKYLGKNVKYPQMAKENGIQGTVFVNFVVGKNGKIRDIKVIRGVNKLLDNEAIRVVKAMPAWKPGKQRGKPVSVSFNLPIRFTLK